MTSTTSDSMLPTSRRLRSEKDFSKLFRKGRPHHHRLLTLKSVRNDLGHPRIGFVVSTKVAKHAVDRNRIKRRLRAIVGKVIGELRGGNDVAIIAKKDAVGASFAEMEAATLRLLEKSGLRSGAEPPKGRA